MYSQEAQTKFIKTKLCQDDPVLYRYYLEGHREKFRKRLWTRDVTDFVQTLITNEARGVIHGAVRTLGKYMRPMGDLIISGGEAFNVYLPKSDRVVTPDIDTKFCPLFRIGKDSIISSRDPRFFEALQITKVLMWDRVGRLTQQLNRVITKKIQRISQGPFGKLLQVKPVANPLRRRYTLIPKKKQSSTSEVKEGDTLIDVELFAIDCRVKFLGTTHNIGGLLDIAFMRPSELGYGIIFDRKVHKGLFVAGKKFLVEDLYMMQALKLRPEKAEKDHLRMYTFATKVLGAKVSKSDSLKQIFLKTLPKAQPDIIGFEKRPYFNRGRLLRRALAVNIHKYPTNPTHRKLGCPVNNKQFLSGAKATQSQFAFDSRKKKWVPVNSTMYIRNEALFRTVKPCEGPQPLYGWSPIRNAAVPKQLIAKSRAIG